MKTDLGPCEACRYYDGVFGTCRHQYPAIVPAYDNQREKSRYQSMWPRVERDDWCGRFEASAP